MRETRRLDRPLITLKEGEAERRSMSAPPLSSVGNCCPFFIIIFSLLSEWRRTNRLLSPEFRSAFTRAELLFGVQKSLTIRDTGETFIRDFFMIASAFTQA